MTCGAVIVTYNSADVLAECVRSLWANNINDIIVIDNASTDDSSQQAQRLGLTCLVQGSNTGFATACNQGAAWLMADLILFHTPDTVVTASAIRRAVRHFADPSVGAIGLLLAGQHGAAEVSSFGADVTITHLISRHLLAPPLPASAQEVAWVSGGALIVRRRAFQQVAGFDPNFFLYWEDVDFCKRLRQAGWRILLEPHAHVQHQRGASLKNLARKTAFYDASADKYFRKHYPTPIWLTQRLLRRTYRRISPLVR